MLGPGGAVFLLAVLCAPAVRAADAQVSADTYINQPLANSNFGGLTFMGVGACSSSSVQFDLSHLQSLGLTSSEIQQVTLTF